jgi:hypothetical protein
MSAMAILQQPPVNDLSPEEPKGKAKHQESHGHQRKS